MSLFTFIKLCGKAFRFVVSRPLQRFNIENRSKKYLGPEAKYFKPAPRAIGSLSLIDGKPPQYPYLEGGGGFKSIKQRRLQAIESKRDQLLESQKNLHPIVELKSYSETELDDIFVRSVVHKLNVTKTPVQINATENAGLLTEPLELTGTEDSSDSQKALAKPTTRLMPKCTNLQRQDQLSIWNIDKTPPGRLNLNMLQELMVNKLVDDAYWTPKKISENYNIKEEYAEQLTKYYKQIIVVVSPRMKNLLDYTARNNPVYEATKDVIYQVDKGLRTEDDKKYDDMFLPHEELDEKVKEILDPPETRIELSEEEEIEKRRRDYIARRPKPLRIGSENQQSQSGAQKVQLKLEDSKRREDDMKT